MESREGAFLSPPEMGDSGNSVSIDIGRNSVGWKELRVETSYGPISVAVYGDQYKPALITYPDVALNHTPASEREEGRGLNWKGTMERAVQS